MTDPALPDRFDALGAVWTVLSRLLLTPPAEETLGQVRDPEWLALWPVRDDDGAVTRGIELLIESATLGEDALAVRRDHNLLFVGPDRLKAPPYESVHRSQERLLFEAETFQVRDWYRRFDLAAPRLNREPDDHIGLELEFLATLATRALSAHEAGDVGGAARLAAAHDAFLTEHVLAWAPAFLKLVRDNAETAFHRGVAELGLGVLAEAVQQP